MSPRTSEYSTNTPAVTAVTMMSEKTYLDDTARMSTYTGRAKRLPRASEIMGRRKTMTAVMPKNTASSSMTVESTTVTGATVSAAKTNCLM